MDSVANDVVGDQKLVPLPVSVFDITGQVLFTEFQIPLGSGAGYEFQVSDSTFSNTIDILLDDLGNVFVLVGPVALAPFWLGTWAPNNGTHKMHFTVDAIGMPTLFIDDVAIPLVLSGNTPSAVTASANNVAIFAMAGVVGVFSALVKNFFLASGVLPPSTVFCCA